MTKPVLMSFVELGGYPNFVPLYEASGYQVVQTDSVRKAVKLIRQHRPDVIVAEFNFQSDFRDRTSSLETLMSSTQGVSEVRLIVFYEKEYSHQYDRFLQQFDVHASIEFPVSEEVLAASIRQTS
jgi:predicted YcjX-like family ATPase